MVIHLARSRTASFAASALLVAGLSLAELPGGAAADGTPATTVAEPEGFSDSVLLAGAPKPAIAQSEASGRRAFLLALGARSTGVAYDRAAVGGKAQGRAAARTQLATIRSAQRATIAALPRDARVLYETHAVVPGVAVEADVADLARLAAIRQVRTIHPIAPARRVNASAVALQGAVSSWQAHGNQGAGVTIAVLDSGLDYTHADFGGPGTTAAYREAFDALGKSPSFPSAKVVGGTDLAGDDYTGENQAQPDPWPLDCIDGHGTHVAGSAAGYGVRADGGTYAGPYDATTPLASMRVGPGVAPLASLFPVRVFGCVGSTTLVPEGFDRAADPNGDGDPSDAVDVISISIGSDYSAADDASSVAANEAAELGISVVVASGNSGDTYEVGGSPGTAVRALTVAASADSAGTFDTLRISAPASIAGEYAADRAVDYDWSSLQDLSGDVIRLAQPGNGDGCEPLVEPHKAQVRGKIVLVDWFDDAADARCSATSVGDELAAAGAAGVVYGSDVDRISAGFYGNKDLPGVIVGLGASDAIDAALAVGPVTVSGTERAGTVVVDPSDEDRVANFTSRGSATAGMVKPDVAAVGETVFSAANGTGIEGRNESGTSMAAPMAAGAAALVLAGHPTWSPEQVKAALVNTAQDVYSGQNRLGDRYAPNRVGGGRIQVDRALATPVMAYAAGGTGAVGVSFGPQEVASSRTLTRTITVDNTGPLAATFDVSYDPVTSVPGAAYSVSPPQLTVPAGTTGAVAVTLSLDASTMTRTIDPTVSRTQFEFPRQYRADASGLVVLESAATDLRVPVYSAPRPTATMTQQGTLVVPPAGVSQTLLPARGTGLNQGTGAETIRSLVAGFELQAVSGRAPVCSEDVDNFCLGSPDQVGGDIRRVGVTSTSPQVAAVGLDPLLGSANFAINTHGPWRTPVGQQEFDVALDIDGDLVADYVSYTAPIGGVSDVPLAYLYEVASDSVIDARSVNHVWGDTDTAAFNSDTLVLPVSLDLLPGVRPGSSRISYTVESYDQYFGGIDRIGLVDQDWVMTGALSFDALNPGVTLTGSYDGSAASLLYFDGPASVLTLRRDAAAYALDGGLGAMIVHFHNRVGDKTQVVALKERGPVRLAVGTRAPVRGKTFRAVVRIDPGAGGPATGQVVLKSGGVVVGRGTVNAGAARVDLALRHPGSRLLRAFYSGDATHQAATSGYLAVRVQRARSAVLLRVADGDVGRGERVRAVVRVPSVGGVAPTGRVILRRADGKVLGSAMVHAGIARISFVSPSAGGYRIFARYLGNRDYLPVRSARLLLR